MGNDSGDDGVGGGPLLQPPFLPGLARGDVDGRLADAAPRVGDLRGVRLPRDHVGDLEREPVAGDAALEPEGRRLLAGDQALLQAASDPVPGEAADLLA